MCASIKIERLQLVVVIHNIKYYINLLEIAANNILHMNIAHLIAYIHFFFVVLAIIYSNLFIIALYAIFVDFITIINIFFFKSHHKTFSRLFLMAQLLTIDFIFQFLFFVSLFQSSFSDVSILSFILNATHINHLFSLFFFPLEFHISLFQVISLLVLNAYCIFCLKRLILTSFIYCVLSKKKNKTKIVSRQCQ